MGGFQMTDLFVVPESCNPPVRRFNDERKLEDTHHHPSVTVRLHDPVRLATLPPLLLHLHSN